MPIYNIERKSAEMLDILAVRLKGITRQIDTKLHHELSPMLGLKIKRSTFSNSSWLPGLNWKKQNKLIWSELDVDVHIVKKCDRRKERRLH